MAILLFLCMATTLVRNTVWSNGISINEDIISKSPNKARGYLNLGILCAVNGNYDRATALFLRSLALDPGNARAYENMGNVYTKQGLFEQAISMYRMAISLDPFLPKLYYNRGIARLNLGRREQAVADFQQSCSLGYLPACEKTTP